MYGSQMFDAVIACMAYHHFKDREGFADEAARVLKPGGILYIIDPRFPWFIRKITNGIFRLIRVAGAFYTPDEVKTHFTAKGFHGAGMAVDGYAQLVKLRRKGL